MPCGDAGRERHTWSYLLIATNKQPFVPWRGTGSEVSPSPGWSHQHPPLPALPRSVTRSDGQRIHMDRACLVAAPGQAHLPLRHDGMGSDQPSAKTLLLCHNPSKRQSFCKFGWQREAGGNCPSPALCTLPQIHQVTLLWRHSPTCTPKRASEASGHPSPSASLRAFLPF